MRVLLAVDLKKDADEVVGAAAAWAGRLDATVDLVYVDEFRSQQPYIRDPTLQTIVQLEWDRLKQDDEAELQRLLELLPEARRGAYHLRTGGAARGVVEMAPGYDVVLVATHGRTGMAHFWLGSVAERVVRSCPKPVLVLRLGQPD